MKQQQLQEMQAQRLAEEQKLKQRLKLLWFSFIGVLVLIIYFLGTAKVGG